MINDIIGETLVRVRALTKASDKRSWLKLFYKKVIAGEILIETSYKEYEKE